VHITIEGLHFCAAHRLMNHKGKCRFLHGHNYKVEVMFYGDKTDDDTGMLVDFGDLKPVVQEAVDTLDHLTILNIEDKDYIAFLKKKGDRVVVVGNEPTCEEIARFLYRRISTLADEKGIDNVVLSQVKIWETPKFSAKVDITDINEE